MQSDDLKTRVMALAISVGVVWCVSLLGLFLLPHLPHELAIVPRRFDSMMGILGMPLVHGSLPHLIANTVPMIFFGALLLSRGVYYYVVVTLAIAVLGGIALWLLGRDAQHIGASGVVFGFFGFLVVRGLYERRLSSIAVTALVILVYGGMVFGVLPRDDHVSWEAHLLGLLAGVAVARAGYALDKRNAVTEGAPR